MDQTCRISGQTFTLDNADLAFLDKVSPVVCGQKYPLPVPTLCPDERMRRRLTFRNQQTLYKRTCDLSGKMILSLYSPDKDQVVYSPDEWWSDKWDAMNFGRDYDFSASFTEQFTKLMRSVPHLAVLISNEQNCQYTNQTYNCKDCYLASAIKDCEGVLYSQNTNNMTDVTDCAFSHNSELLYECTDSYDCYGCNFAEHCFNCSDCSFLFDCIGCKHCFGCVGLRQQEYQFFNEQLSPEEYQQNVAAYALHTYDGFQKALADMRAMLERTPHETVFLRKCEDVTGNNVQNSRGCVHCFDSLDLEDCRYSSWIFGCKDAADCYGMGESQVMYDCVGVEEVQYTAFSFGTSHSQNCYYTDLCFNCSNCFGCVGLRNQKYCIFNKQYSEEQYPNVVAQIIEHMKEAGEWGEFFDPSVSAFAYNESKASELFPLTKEEALGRGYRWKDDIDQPPQAEKIIPASRLPDNIDDIPDDILNWAINCEQTGRPYKVTKLELDFYRKRRLPVPHLHPDVRMIARSARR